MSYSIVYLYPKNKTISFKTEEKGDLSSFLSNDRDVIKDDVKEDILDNTVKKHASVYKVPFFKVDTFENLGQFVKENVKTNYVMLAKKNTYIHVSNILRVINDIKDLVIAGGHPNQYENKQFLDFDAGYLCKSEFLHNFSIKPENREKLFDLNMLEYLSSIPGTTPINVIGGFNKLNFEGSYQNVHTCEKCEQSFKTLDVFTFGNMNESEMTRYHSVLEKIRVGDNVQVALAFMIKDEELKVQETLDVYKNHKYFPEIYILDTGSTDKTLEKVKEWGERHPETKIFVYEEPFVDFSYNRNFILDKAYEQSKCEYIISIDCNDELKEQDTFIKGLAKFYHFPCIFLTQIWKTHNGDPIEFANIRVVKNNKAYRWKYRVHEVLINEQVPNNKFIIQLPRETHLYQFREEQYEKEKSARYKRDLKYFLEDYEKDPKDKRIVYYTAQTYFFNQDYENCIKYSKERIALNKEGEKDEEVYQSIFRIAKCKMILNKPAYNIRKWLWFAWEYMKDVEPLLYIAQYYDDTDVKTAHHLYRLACDYPLPNFSLPVRRELYNFERYRKLAESYYKLKMFKETYETYQKILTENCRPDQKETVKNMIEMFYPYYHAPNKPLLVIYGGFFYDRYWNGKMFYENKISLGGSESMVIKLAHLLAKEYNVYVFLNTEQDVVYNDVKYVKVEKYQQFLDINKVKHLILSRDSSKTHSNAEQTHLWLHDLVNIGNLTSPKDYKNIITLSKFHRDYFEKHLDNIVLNPKERKEYASKLRIIPNICDIVENVSRKKNQSYRFIYSSCPTRGLLKVLEDFELVKQKYEDAELYIYSDFNNDYVKSRMNVNAVLMKLASMKGVYNVGRMPEKLFIEECKKCNFWYYPTDFLETFCITAVQMMHCGVIPLYRPVGALPNVIMQAGVKVEAEQPILSVLEKIQEPKQRNRLMEVGFDTAKKYIDKNVKKMWLSLLQ